MEPLTILFCTDNHLGYLEKDPLRGNDSFESFEQALKYAKEYNVDCILLGGDLFHENKPSRQTLYRTMDLFRKYCMGDRPVQIQVVSDPETHFGRVLNMEDPNLNVQFPIFAIHGNHDDPVGGLTKQGHTMSFPLCAMDLLSVGGLLNYFGKTISVDNINLSPILIKKGDHRLALYGLGNVRDERLHRTFLAGNVHWERPEEEEWFNLFMIHQNRTAHGGTNYIPESFLPSFLNLVLWAHEHDSISEPEYNQQGEFHVIQLGSTVSTGVNLGESLTKHAGILKIFNGNKFEWKSLPLRTRPIVFDELVLKDVVGLRPSNQKGVECCIKAHISKMIERGQRLWMENGGEGITLPLIRLRIDYTGDFVPLNPIRFGQGFENQVANPRNLVTFHRKKNKVEESKIIEPVNEQRAVDIHDLVKDYFNAQKLSILEEQGLSEAVRLFVEKDDKDSIERCVNSFLTVLQERLSDTIRDEETLKEQIEVEKQRKELQQVQIAEKEPSAIENQPPEYVAPKKKALKRKAVTKQPRKTRATNQLAFSNAMEIEDDDELSYSK